MSKGINKVILIGHLGNDPEVKYMPSGSAVANLSLATTDSWRDKASGERQERTEWHRLVLYGKTAEVAGEYLRKGAQVYVEGRLQTRKWQGQDGQDRYTTEIVVNELRMLRPAATNGSSVPAARPGIGRPSGESTPPASGQTQQPAAAQAADFDDDIPFEAMLPRCGYLV